MQRSILEPVWVCRQYRQPLLGLQRMNSQRLTLLDIPSVHGSCQVGSSMIQWMALKLARALLVGDILHVQTSESGFDSTTDAVMPNPMQSIRIVRDDGQQDAITRRRYSHYNEAYDVLERFYADLCCSDERIEYSIVEDAAIASKD